MKDFKNKVAVITGGASGVGLSLGRALAKEGAEVILTDIEKEALNDAVKLLSEEGLRVHSLLANVADLDSMKTLSDAINNKFGNVHLLFNNAGIAPQEASFPIWDLSINDWEWAFKVNVWGVIHGIKAFVPLMLSHGEESRVINTCSGNGALVTYPSTPIYATTKSSVATISEALYFQLLSLESSVGASILFPGPHVVETGLYGSERNRPKDLAQEKEPAFKIESLEAMKEMVSSMGKELRTTHPDEVANFCLEGIKKNQYWLLPDNQDSDKSYKDFVESLLSRTNPNLPDLF